MTFLTQAEVEQIKAEATEKARAAVAAPIVPAPCGWSTGCDEMAPFAGAYCDRHHLEHKAQMSTRIEGMSAPERKSNGGPGVAAPQDPALVARIAAAREFLASYAGKNSFILDLRADRKYGTKWFRITERMADAILRVKEREAGWEQERQQREAQAPRPQSAPAGEGWYILDGDVYKVQIAVHGSQRPYAKRLQVEAGQRGEWVYAPGMVNRLTEADRLSEEQAAAMGRLYGVCVVCGAVLTDEASIERGIGPVCAGRIG